MKRLSIVVAVVAALAFAGCKHKGPSPHGKMGANGPPPTTFRVIPIGYNPSVTGLTGAVGEIVYENGGGHAWVHGTTASNTDWSVFPGSGGGSGTIADGGVAAPLSGNGSTASPLALVLADQCAFGNVSGATGPGGCLTKAQELTRLGITPFSTDESNQTIRCQSLIGLTATAVLFTHFKDNTFSTTGSGGGTTTLSTTARAGVVNVSTGSVASHVAIVRFAGNGIQIDDIKTSKWCAAWRAQFPTATDSATDDELQVLSSGNTLIEFGPRGGRSTTFFSIYGRGGTGGAPFVDAATSVALDTVSYHTVEIWQDGTNVDYAMDGTTVSSTAVSGIAGGEALYIDGQASNTTTAANRQINIDWMGMWIAPN